MGVIVSLCGNTMINIDQPVITMDVIVSFIVML